MKNAARWVGVLAGIGLGYFSFWAIVGGLISHAGTGPDESATGALIAIWVGVAMFIAGWALGMVSFPTFTACAGLCTAPFLLLTAVVAALSAMVLSRAEPTGFDGSRAAHDAWLGAAIALI